MVFGVGGCGLRWVAVVVQANPANFAATDYDTDEVPVIAARPSNFCAGTVDPNWYEIL